MMKNRNRTKTMAMSNVATSSGPLPVRRPRFPNLTDAIKYNLFNFWCCLVLFGAVWCCLVLKIKINFFWTVALFSGKRKRRDAPNWVESGAVIEKDGTVRAFVLAAGLLAMAGCQTVPRTPPPLTTVEVSDPLEVAEAAPLPALPTEPSGWPTNWVNTWIPLESWAQLNGLGKPVRIPSNPHPSFVFKLPAGTLALKIGSRIGQCVGLEYWLGFAPQIVNGLPYV